MRLLSTFAAALLLASSSITVMASEKPDAASEGTLSQDHTYEPVAHINNGIDVGAGWLISGDIRAGWLQYGYDNPASAHFQGPGDKYQKGNPDINKGHTDSQGFYVIPKISITTPMLSGFYAKVTGAAATDFGINDVNDESRNFVFDGNDRKSYAILQEAHVAFDANGNRVMIGAEELTTPMIDADDWYMLANTFQMAYYTNTMLEDNMFTVGYFYKMAGVWDSGANGTEYHSMSDASFVSQADKDNADDSGVITAVYQFNNNIHNFQVWNYYAEELYNTLFAQYDFTQKSGTFSYDFGLQYIDFQEVGALEENDFSHIDYSIYSARFDGGLESGFNFATGISKYTDGEGQNETLGAWGGYPYFANGMIFHFFEAGTLRNAASYKAQFGYDIGDVHWLGVRYTGWDLDPEYSQTATGKPQDAMNMYGIRYSYNGKAGEYFTGTYEYVDLDNEPDIFALRLIGGVKF